MSYYCNCRPVAIHTLHTHTSHQDKGSDTYTEAYTHTRAQTHTHTRTHSTSRRRQPHTYPGRTLGPILMVKGALTLGHLYRAHFRFTPVPCSSLDRLASVSTPTVFKYSSIPWPEHIWERCAQAMVQMVMSHTHGYAT